jgi:hypothetical protein
MTPDHPDDAFPMDVTDGPWRFRPDGYLVAILHDDAEADRASDALVSGGFASENIKTYTAAETLANHERYAGNRTRGERIVGAVLDDDESRALYLSYARDGRAALWLRIPDTADVPKALKILAVDGYVHTRHFGPTTTDLRTSEA